MKRRHFDSKDNAELHAKIDKAKQLLSVPDLMRQLGYEEKHITRTAICPFHDDQKPSFSVFNRGKGWQWKCHAGCGHGDEIGFLVKHFDISRKEAIKRYLDMAGFPVRSRPVSRKYPSNCISKSLNL
jgi:DNA primase